MFAVGARSPAVYNTLILTSLDPEGRHDLQKIRENVQALDYCLESRLSETKPAPGVRLRNEAISDGQCTTQSLLQLSQVLTRWWYLDMVALFDQRYSVPPQC